MGNTEAVISAENVKGGYRKDGERYVIDDIQGLSVSNKIGSVTFGLQEMGYSSPIFFSDEVVEALHLLGVRDRVFNPIDFF